ncbi:hypothetical protein BV22DRAFT_1195561 [Leucogyrophana mollusca]|uniref:Uncharacterized protein n=1 Tax=Leucogyrophana mollusca TaxID=85980 RepID=A0ACB8BIA0_9AGAM|nr:hypothetical protein BV22DRAFT_1195561 [Leucogyrophana mollusca]
MLSSNTHASAGDMKDERRLKMKQKRSFSNLFAKSSSSITSQRSPQPNDQMNSVRSGHTYNNSNAVGGYQKPAVPKLDIPHATQRSAPVSPVIPTTPRMKTMRDTIQDLGLCESVVNAQPVITGGNVVARQPIPFGDGIPTFPRSSTSSNATAPRSQPPSPSTRRPTLRARENERPRTSSKVQHVQHNYNLPPPPASRHDGPLSGPPRNSPEFAPGNRRQERRPQTADGSSRSETFCKREKHYMKNLPPLPPLPPPAATSLGSRVKPPKPLVIYPYHHRTRSVPTLSPSPTLKHHSRPRTAANSSPSSPQIPLGTREDVTCALERPVLYVHPPPPHLSVSVPSPPLHTKQELSRPSSMYSSEIDHRSVDSSTTSPLPTTPLYEPGESPLGEHVAHSNVSRSHLTVSSAKSRSNRLSRVGPKSSSSSQGWTPPSDWSGPLPSDSDPNKGDDTNVLSKLVRLRKQKSTPRIDNSETKPFFAHLNLSSPSMWHPLPKRKVGGERNDKADDPVRPVKAAEEVVVTMRNFESDDLQVQAMTDVIPRLRELKSSKSWLRTKVW